MRNYKIVVAGIACIGLLGCDPENLPLRKYEIQIVDGKVYRLEIRTGEVAVISERGINRYTVDAFNEAVTPSTTSTVASQVVPLPESDEMISGAVRYRWLAGELLYEYSFGPYDESLDSARVGDLSRLTINFTDGAGFVMAEGEVPLGELTRISDGSKRTAWSYRGAVKVSEERYKEIVYTSPLWRYTDSFDSALSKYVAKQKKEKQIQSAPAATKEPS